METENAELNNRIQDLEYAYEKSSQREEKLDRHLAEALQKLKNYEMLGNAESTNQVITGVAQFKVDPLAGELEINFSICWRAFKYTNSLLLFREIKNASENTQSGWWTCVDVQAGFWSVIIY